MGAWLHALVCACVTLVPSGAGPRDAMRNCAAVQWAPRVRSPGSGATAWNAWAQEREHSSASITDIRAIAPPAKRHWAAAVWAAQLGFVVTHEHKLGNNW